MDIERINTYSSKHTIVGWFVGLAYYNWFSSSAEPVSLWGHVALIVIGMFAASIIIGGGVAIVIGLITRIATGSSMEVSMVTLGALTFRRYSRSSPQSTLYNSHI